MKYLKYFENKLDPYNEEDWNENDDNVFDAYKIAKKLLDKFPHGIEFNPINEYDEKWEIIRDVEMAIIENFDFNDYNKYESEQIENVLSNLITQKVKETINNNISIENIEKNGKLITDFTVDEYDEIEDAGFGEIYDYKDKRYTIIDWVAGSEKGPGKEISSIENKKL